MESKISQWFETKIRYEKTIGDGDIKKVTEVYTVEALSFSEAEAAITKEMEHYIHGEFQVKAITPAVYSEIFFSNDDNDDKWFKAKLSFITLDEKSEKEKRSFITYLVQAKSINTTVKHIDEVMSKTMIDYEIASIVETKIRDVFTHDLNSINDNK